MYEEFIHESTNSPHQARLVGRLWVMPQGVDTIRVSSHCYAREYDNKRQEDMFINAVDVAVRSAVTVRRDDKGEWKVDGQYSFLDRFAHEYPSKDVSRAARELVEKVSRSVADRFAEMRPDKMFASEIVSIGNEIKSKESKLEGVEEEAKGLKKDIQELTARWNRAVMAKVKAVITWSRPMLRQEVRHEYLDD